MRIQARLKWVSQRKFTRIKRTKTLSNILNLLKMLPMFYRLVSSEMPPVKTLLWSMVMILSC